MSIVARRYAQALMNLAGQPKQIEPVAVALDEIADAISGSAELQAFLSEPKVALSAKEAVVEQLLAKAGPPPLVRTFVRFVTRKRRIELLDEIRREFHELADERSGRAKAVVTVAAQLSAPQQTALRERLSALTGKKDVQLDVRVDPNILGGLVARVGSTVWDSSLRNQLSRIQQALVKG
jgi:F-type H+-transporting ATPase subunit delta